MCYVYKRQISILISKIMFKEVTNGRQEMSTL